MMALSNWDTLAVDAKGNPIEGSYTSPLGVTARIYKNWLSIEDPKAWRDGGNYIKPVVMHLVDGELHYQDLSIKAVRRETPQGGIYVMITCRFLKPVVARRLKKDKNTVIDYNEDYILEGMLACGVYAYNGDKYVGVSKDSLKVLEKLRKEVNGWNSSDFLLTNAMRFNQGDAVLMGGVKNASTKVGAQAKDTFLATAINQGLFDPKPGLSKRKGRSK